MPKLEKGDTGNSRYVDFAYLDTITYVEVIFHSHTFATAYVEVKNQLSQGSRYYLLCLCICITWGAKIFQTMVKSLVI